MKLLFIISALMLASCGVSRVEPIYGKTTKEELIKLKGEPLKEEDIPVTDSKVLHFANDEKYQVKDNLITNGFINPNKDETSLIYWKHAFKDYDVTIEKIATDADLHEGADLLMKCAALGVGVVYNERANSVKRVIKYEKK